MHARTHKLTYDHGKGFCFFTTSYFSVQLKAQMRTELRTLWIIFLNTTYPFCTIFVYREFKEKLLKKKFGFKQEKQAEKLICLTLHFFYDCRFDTQKYAAYILAMYKIIFSQLFAMSDFCCCWLSKTKHIAPLTHNSIKHAFLLIVKYTMSSQMMSRGFPGNP